MIDPNRLAAIKALAPYLDLKRLGVAAADPSHGMKAMAEEILEVRRLMEAIPHWPNCAVNKEICKTCGKDYGEHYGSNCYSSHDLDTWDPVKAPCNCIKSRIGEATVKESLTVQPCPACLKTPGRYINGNENLECSFCLGTGKSRIGEVKA